jgi:hypothetical protein
LAKLTLNIGENKITARARDSEGNISMEGDGDEYHSPSFCASIFLMALMTAVVHTFPFLEISAMEIPSSGFRG